MKSFLPFLFLILSSSFISAEDYPPALRWGEEIISHRHYSLVYSEADEQPLWVYYTLTSQEAAGGFPREDHFRTDPAIMSESASLSDYRGSGYDRGHLAPAADMAFSAQAMDESFFLSNMCPQDPSFNRGIWKELEALVRDWAKELGTLEIVTGPILTGGPYPTIGENEVTIPPAYYKAILLLESEQPQGIAFLLPNTRLEGDPGDYALTIDALETAVGLDFFTLVDDERESVAEAVRNPSFWGMNTSTESFSSASYPSVISVPEEPAVPFHYWINSTNGTRHNSGCRYYGNTSGGYFTNEPEGTPCGVCGG